MYSDPLIDFDSRLLNFSANTPTNLVVDLLLRLHNAKNWAEPVTIYISPSENSSALTVLEFLKIHAVLRAIRSPVHTVALGMLRGYELLLLASGVKGHRHILEHSLLFVEPFGFEGLPFTDHPIGIEHVKGTSLYEQATELLRAELAVVLRHMRLDATLFQTPRVLSAAQAIALGIADRVAPFPKP